MRRPLKKPPIPASPRPPIPASPRPVIRVSELTPSELIDQVCRASSPVWVDLAQRRRWLEAIAAEHRTEAQKMAHLCAAAQEIGFDCRID
jgi:hypothetical protein